MLIEQIPLENGCALGLRFEMQKYPLLVIRAEKGFLMCGYLNVSAAETLGDVAVKVKGVQSFGDMLKATVVEVTKFARELGVETGMTGREALEKKCSEGQNCFTGIFAVSYMLPPITPTYHIYHN